MKRKAKEVEVVTMKRFASVTGSKTKSMFGEIFNVLLSSDHQHLGCNENQLCFEVRPLPREEDQPPACPAQKLF
jgi:hypothetical protein